MPLNATKILERIMDQNASDLHLVVGSVPIIRVNTKLVPMEDMQALSLEDIEYFLSQILETDQKELLEVNKELDFSVALGSKSRFRVNAYYQRGYSSVALRHIPVDIPSLSDLHLPDTVKQLCGLTQGLVLVVGPTGQGKSTTIASMIDYINETRAEHIVTVEDPIEYVFTNKLSLIEQREMYIDTHSWPAALKSVLRQDPNIIFVGEMRDTETVEAALNIAETGHLVFATLHTNSASQTIERIISSFPEAKQDQVKEQLAGVMEVVLSQRLVVSLDSKVIPAVEVMLGNDAVRNLIREGKPHLIDNVIDTSLHLGMISMERSLADLVNNNVITFEEAAKHTSRVGELRRLVKGVKSR